MAEGEDIALGELYDRYGRTLYALALAIVREPADAEEVVVDAFGQAWRQAAAFDPLRGSVGAWLATIARSRALDMVRARGRRTRAHERAAQLSDEGIATPVAALGPDPGRGVERSEARRLVAQALSSLPEPQRVAIELAYFEGLSQSEIAERRAFRHGLAIAPQDARLLAAMARLEAARGGSHWRGAIAFGERAIAIAPDPATLGLVGDGYSALGDSAQAASYWRAMEAVTLAQPGGFHRAWSLFLLDHERRVPEVLERVREEIRTRPDIYGWDLLAWALHRAGLDQEALPVMARALSLGTQDASLFYHAGMIERSLGHRIAARDALTRALATNPWFPQAAQARAELESL
jgi:RNA polymerase sigma-70 factor (ECF subfamily)